MTTPKQRKIQRGTITILETVGTKGDDRLEGVAGIDHMDGKEGNDTLEGRGGNDRLRGGKGDDKLFGGEGNDHLIGGEGNDMLKGGKGDDLLYGGEGNDILKGGKGDDSLYGREGDILKGGSGDDYLVGLSGMVELHGGPGKDIFQIDRVASRNSSGHSIIKDFTHGEDKILILKGSSISSTNNGKDAAIYKDDNLLAVVEGVAPHLLRTDPVTVPRPNLRWRGGVNYRANSQYIEGVGNKIGTDGDDHLWGDHRNDFISGGNGDDKIEGRGGNDVLTGEFGNDQLIGGEGDDSLYGLEGNDILIGGSGLDEVNGGQGRDTFILTRGAGHDIITDFTNGEDRIQIESDWTLGTTTDGRHAAILEGNDLLAVVQGVGKDGLTKTSNEGKDYFV